MNGILKIAIIAIILTLPGGCSVASGDGSNANSSAANGNSSSTANTVSVSNTGMIPYPGSGNTSGAPPANSDVQAVSIDPKQLKPTSAGIPAADNSEVISRLNEKGAVETRIFKSHPVLAKVEKTTFGKDVQLKVYLKNGKVVPVPLEKIKNFINDSAEQILQAAGMQPPKPVQNVDTGAATGTKTEETKDSKPNGASQTPNAPPIKAPTKP
ncbi:MAG TPA: hypothetical protein VF599_16645 [Pyrinomonadaceae bacterium]|jgi:hypothetical protein